jgi:hypothetical protein
MSIKEYFESYINKRIRKKLIHELYIPHSLAVRENSFFYSSKEIEVLSFYKAFTRGFSWKNSIYGYIFWSNFYEKNYSNYLIQNEDY